MSNARVLIVEDNEERIELFRRWLPKGFIGLFATSAGRAMRMIELDPGAVYAGIALDFDLNEQVVCHEEYRYDGGHVATKVVAHVAADVPILIHSMNAVGGPVMRERLSAAGFDVTHIPFIQLTESIFVDWLDLVRTELEFRSS